MVGISPPQGRHSRRLNLRLRRANGRLGALGKNMISAVFRVVRGFGLGAGLLLAGIGQGASQGASQVAAQDDVTIEWEVANRFRLFAEQVDFDAHVRAFRAVNGKTVLEIEQRLADQSRGIGWAAGFHRLCYDSWTGQLPARCRRDGVEENYPNPRDVRIKLTARLPADFGNGVCT